MMTIKLWNHTDIDNARQRLISKAAVRTAEVQGLVDTGATVLMLPADIVKRLGVRVVGRARVKMADGKLHGLPKVGGIRLSILGREMTCDALVGRAGSTALIGQMQLEELDLIVDPKSRECRVNPASPDMPLLDLLAVA